MAVFASVCHYLNDIVKTCKKCNYEWFCFFKKRASQDSCRKNPMCTLTSHPHPSPPLLPILPWPHQPVYCSWWNLYGSFTTNTYTWNENIVVVCVCVCVCVCVLFNVYNTYYSAGAFYCSLTLFGSGDADFNIYTVTTLQRLLNVFFSVIKCSVTLQLKEDDSLSF